MIINNLLWVVTPPPNIEYAMGTLIPDRYRYIDSFVPIFTYGSKIVQRLVA